MTHRTEHHDLIEELWLESEEARRAGVFDRTPIEPAKLVSLSPALPNAASWVTGRRLLAAAAMVALVAGAWTVLFQLEFDSLRRRTDAAAKMTSVASATFAKQFTNCLEGPGAAGAEGDCALQDIDADGDVDLRDFSLRIALASRSQ